MTKLMIYGASGYTGRMAAGHAKAAGLDVILAGRSEAPLAAIGGAYRVFSVDDRIALDEALSDVSVLLNCAGPFTRTAKPLMEAAIRAGVHYLDTAAELDSYRLAQILDADAKTAGVMLLPGSGGSVAMLGSLAGHAAKRVANPQKISIALLVSGSMSRGSAISATENLTTECLKRVDGALVACGPEGVRDFDFGKGPVACFPLTLPDLVTIWETTHIPNIETFVHVSGDAFPTGNLSALPDGPTAEQPIAIKPQSKSIEKTARLSGRYWIRSTATHLRQWQLPKPRGASLVEKFDLASRRRRECLATVLPRQSLIRRSQTCNWARSSRHTR